MDKTTKQKFTAGFKLYFNLQTKKPVKTGLFFFFNLTGFKNLSGVNLYDCY